MTPGDPSERDRQSRRTRSVRRGVVAAGATGALGAALAIGTTIHTTGSAAPGVSDDNASTDGGGTADLPDRQGFDQGEQAPQAGQLAGPSGGGPALGHSAGS